MVLWQISRKFLIKNLPMPSKVYQVIASPRFLKDLKKIDSQVAKRISQAIELLVANPFIGKKLVNVEIGQWRFRIGNYRLRYDVEEDKILLYRIRHRKDSYKR